MFVSAARVLVQLGLGGVFLVGLVVVFPPALPAAGTLLLALVIGVLWDEMKRRRRKRLEQERRAAELAERKRQAAAAVTGAREAVSTAAATMVATAGATVDALAARVRPAPPAPAAPEGERGSPPSRDPASRRWSFRDRGRTRGS